MLLVNNILRVLHRCVPPLGSQKPVELELEAICGATLRAKHLRTVPHLEFGFGDKAEYGGGGIGEEFSNRLIGYKNLSDQSIGASAMPLSIHID